MIPDSKASSLTNRIMKIYVGLTTIAKSSEQIALQELQALADVNLGEDYDRRKIAEVAELQRIFRARKEKLAALLAAREISSQQFTISLKTMLAETSMDCEKVLGPKDFQRLFGITTKDVPDLVNH